MTAETEALCKRLEALAELNDRGRGISDTDINREAAAKLREMAGALSGLVERADDCAWTMNASMMDEAIRIARAALGGSHG